MEQIYNKLVRDNIPEIIKNNGETPVTRILSDEEYKVAVNQRKVSKVIILFDDGTYQEM